MGAALDDQLGALVRVLAAQVGHALFGHDDLDGVLAVVGMADERDDRADLAALGRGRAGEDRDVGVAREVAGAADAVHEVAAHDMGAVHIAEEVDLDRGVDR